MISLRNNKLQKVWQGVKFLAKYAALCYFAAIIFHKFACSLIPVKYGALSDNRMPARFPTELSLNFPAEFDAYYQDNFPNRKKLVKRYNKTRKKRFGISDYIITGKEDWMFFNSVKSEIKSDQLADFLGTNLYSPEHLDEIMSILMSDIKKFEALGAKVLVTFPPNKMRIYSEYMPDIYQKKKADYTRTDQLRDALRDRGVKVVDYTDLFMEEKKDHRLFLRTDTHWTKYGGYLAYRRLFDNLQAMGLLKGQKPITITKLSKKDRGCGDNFKTEGVFVPCSEWDYVLEYTQPITHTCTNRGKHPEINYGVDNMLCQTEGKKEKLLVIRDSFFDNIHPLLAEHFGRTVLLWRTLLSYPEMTEIIKEEKPDVVILEYQERFSFYVADTIFQE